MSVIARAFEARGLPTLMMSTLHDVVKAYKPPRAIVVDFPIGSPCGRIGDPDHQRRVLREAFATPLEAERTLNWLDVDYGTVGDQTWEEITFDLYRQGWAITVDHIARHRAAGGVPLQGREREFTITCNC